MFMIGSDIIFLSTERNMICLTFTLKPAFRCSGRGRILLQISTTGWFLPLDISFRIWVIKPPISFGPYLIVSGNTVFSPESIDVSLLWSQHKCFYHDYYLIWRYANVFNAFVIFSIFYGVDFIVVIVS